MRVAALNKQGLSTWIDATATSTASKPNPATAEPANMAASGDTSGTTAELAITWSAPADSPAAITAYIWRTMAGSVINIRRGTVKASDGDQNGDYTITAQAEPGTRYSVWLYSASAKNRSNYTLPARAQCPS